MIVFWDVRFKLCHAVKKPIKIIFCTDNNFMQCFDFF